MNFLVNASPLAGREGCRDEPPAARAAGARDQEQRRAARGISRGYRHFHRFGRGELHLTILIENMRREGYELAVSRPRVVIKEIDGEKCEPFELLTVDVEEQNQGAVMEELDSAAASSWRWFRTAKAACAWTTASRRAGSSASRASS